MQKLILRYVNLFSCFIKACYILPAFVFFISSQQSFAQTDTAKKLKEVKISTSVIPQVQTLAPSQQITAKDFIRNSAYNVADAIRNFAGVNIKDYGGIGGLKTVSVRSLGADNVAVLYDGVQLNDAQSGQIDLGKFNLNNISSIALYNAQPADVCQTARAFSSASVLSVKTVIPVLSITKPYQITVGLKGGSFGLFNPYMQWQQRLSNRWAFIINGSEELANGRYKYKAINTGADTIATRQNDQVDAQQFDAGLFWTKNDSAKFSLRLNYYHSDRGLPGPNIINAILPDQYLHNRDYFIQAGYEHAASNSFQVKINTRLTQSYLNYFNSPYLNVKGYIDESYTQREIYQSVVVAYRIMRNWQVSYASDVDVSDLNSDVYSYAFPTRLSLFNVLATDVSIGKLHLQANLLNTYINDDVQVGPAAVSRSKFTPTIIASIQPFKTTDFQLRAFYKAIYRNPTFAEQYYYAVAPRLLKPEYNRQVNLGASYSKTNLGLLDYITLTADAYYNNVHDKIIFIPARSQSTPSAMNLGTVDIKGLDINLKSRANIASQCKGLLSVSYTYQQALDVTNPTDSYYLQQIPYVPVHTLALNAGADYHAFKLYYNQVLSSARYRSSDNTAANYLSSYSVSDLSLGCHFLIRQNSINTSVEVNNLFDKNYNVISNYPMPGRSFRLTFQITI
ncbi:TonB-dependent receptor plug domain-containing protein [Mucilaginibacter sp. HMF5004]|uniref:TonB-dependent receptor plug domain-containing protein n=1 Tax=Mucilaginibacter rivuli TaxID=2857527 RepID=UPI001C5E7785|nr:TonB-dependent receptor plug domain-containing protein [Mucilaginibacter rivuli]MBW4889080.1 TonB-dependent receptor plug domain-containing protein [Mucilaginibacter rivuli]